MAVSPPLVSTLVAGAGATAAIRSPPSQPTTLSLGDVSQMQQQLVLYEALARSHQESLQASRKEAALEAVQTLLSRLKPPTLKQALSDLGLPIDGLDRQEAMLTRIADALQPDTRLPLRHASRYRGKHGGK